MDRSVPTDAVGAALLLVVIRNQRSSDFRSKFKKIGKALDRKHSRFIRLLTRDKGKALKSDVHLFFNFSIIRYAFTNTGGAGSVYNTFQKEADFCFLQETPRLAGMQEVLDKDCYESSSNVW